MVSGLFNVDFRPRGFLVTNSAAESDEEPGSKISQPQTSRSLQSHQGFMEGQNKTWSQTKPEAVTLYHRSSGGASVCSALAVFTENSAKIPLCLLFISPPSSPLLDRKIPVHVSTSKCEKLTFCFSLCTVALSLSFNEHILLWRFKMGEKRNHCGRQVWGEGSGPGEVVCCSVNVHKAWTVWPVVSPFVWLFFF